MADATAEARVLDLVATANPANALSLFVEWRTEPASPTRLAVDCGEGHQPVYGDDRPRTEHRVFVMGLWDGASCTLEVTAEADGYATTTAAEAVEIGPLPEYLPEVAIDVHEVGAVQPGWTLLNLTNGHLGEPFKVALIDEQGRYRWYHQLDVTHQGGDNDTRVVSEGVLIGGLHSLIAPTVVDWEGNVVWREQLLAHHDIRPDGDEDRFIYLSRISDCPQEGLASDVVRVWDRAAREIVWRWKTCEHYPVEGASGDWDHLNTVEHVPGEDALILSPRNLNRLLKVDRASGAVLWALGEEGDFELADEDQFLHQHAPEVQPGGSILLFDNGLAGVREWSRAIEIAYDEEQMTAEVIWEFRPQPDLFAPIWSDADRLPNGNTLVTFGRRAASRDSHIIEVSPASEEVWHLRLPPGWGVYRAQRVVDVPLGYVVEPE